MYARIHVRKHTCTHANVQVCNIMNSVLFKQRVVNNTMQRISRFPGTLTNYMLLTLHMNSILL